MKIKIATIVFLALFTSVGAQVSANVQNENACIIEQPLPERPDDFGTLDAQTSVRFRVEFMSNGKLGKVAIVTSSRIKRLDDLASNAVAKIRFEPKRINGSPISTTETIIYRYSWRIPGWSVVRLESLKECSVEKK